MADLYGDLAVAEVSYQAQRKSATAETLGGAQIEGRFIVWASPFCCTSLRVVQQEKKLKENTNCD